MGEMGELHEVLKHVFAGKLKPVVDRTFPLSETRAAHEYLAKSEMFGKVVLTRVSSEKGSCLEGQVSAVPKLSKGTTSGRERSDSLRG